MDVLSHEVVPEFSYSHVDSANFTNLLKLSVEVLSRNSLWLTDFNPKQRFSWGVLATCCSKITVSESLDCVVHYSSVMYDLGHVFHAYSKAKLRGKEPYIYNNLPNEIMNHESMDLRK